MARRNVLIAFFLNLLFAISEFIFGILFNSSAILADAVHDLGDALAIGLSVVTEYLSDKEADKRFSLGYKRFSLLGAMITSAILISGSAFILVENMPKLFKPEVVNKEGMFWMGVIAITINLIASRVVSHGHTKNESILSLHFLEDTLGWLAVIIVSIVLRFTDWYFLDPLLSLLIAVFILTKAVPKFWENTKIFLNAVPEHIDLKHLEEELVALDALDSLNQLNVWSADGMTNQAMLHICKSPDVSDREVKQAIYHVLESYQINLATIEIDQDEKEHEKHRQLKCHRKVNQNQHFH